jgi:CRP-like cAMP-binding protein
MTEIMSGTALARARGMGVREVLEHAPAFAGASAKVLEHMTASASEQTHARGAYLWHAGDPADTLAVVRTGLFKVVRAAVQERSAICALVGAREIIGDFAILQHIPYPVDAIVATECATVIVLPAAVLTDSLPLCPRLAASLACALQAKLVALHDKVDVLSAGPVEARLATLLLKLYERFGDDCDDDTAVIPVALSRRELADFVSTSFETAIRIMSRWEKSGVLETQHGGFLIRDLDALERTATGVA